ncbi:MAG: rod shape-determining protein [Nitrospinota bacterium]
MFLRLLCRWLPTDIGMDLGTANSLLYVRRRGIVLMEPSVVALDQATGKVLAVGQQAKEMWGKVPEGIAIVRPMKDGVIADYEITKAMIKYFIRKIYKGRRYFRPKMIVCIPSGITQVEKRAVRESTIDAGAGSVHLVEEPMAAAIGAKLPIGQTGGNMVVDIGGGTTEVAVISRYATVYNESIRVAGDEMDEAVQTQIRKAYNLVIGPFEAERAKIEIGSAAVLNSRLETVVRGRDLVNGVPRAVSVDDHTIREALNSPVRAIVDSIRRALERTSPEQAADITRRGIVLAGGGSLLKGLGSRLHEETNLPIYRAKEPLTAIVRGTGEILENTKRLFRVCVS